MGRGSYELTQREERKHARAAAPQRACMHARTSTPCLLSHARVSCSYSLATMILRPPRPPFFIMCGSGDAATMRTGSRPVSSTCRGGAVGGGVRARSGGEGARGARARRRASAPRHAAHLHDVCAELLHPVAAGKAAVARARVQHADDVLRLEQLDIIGARVGRQHRPVAARARQRDLEPGLLQQRENVLLHVALGQAQEDGRRRRRGRGRGGGAAGGCGRRHRGEETGRHRDEISEREPKLGAEADAKGEKCWQRRRDATQNDEVR